MGACTKCKVQQAAPPFKSCARCNLLRNRARWRKKHGQVLHTECYIYRGVMVAHTEWRHSISPYELDGYLKDSLER